MTRKYTLQLGGPLSLPWGLYVLICQVDLDFLKLVFSNNVRHRYLCCCFQRTPEKSCLNDVTEVGTWRKVLLGSAVLFVVLTLLPVWDELAEELGMGMITTF